MFNHKRLILWFAVLLMTLVIVACTSATSTEPPQQLDDSLSASSTAEFTLEPTDTSSPAPTATDLPTETALPTITPTITLTPFPTMSASGGGIIAFASEIDNDRDIHLMNADGSSELALTSGSGWDNWPSWSPDGNRIAFTCRNSIPGSGGGICVMDVDGSNIDRLTSADDWEPAWSPDGTRIAFASLRDGNPELYIMDADGKNQQRLTENDVDDWQAAWSPDGMKLAYTSGLDGNWNIYIMDLSAGIPSSRETITQLTYHNAKDSFPAWSPDGNEISFTSTRDGIEELYLMNADGTYKRRLTENDAIDDQSAWSPDGSKIAFMSNRDNNHEIFVMDLESSEVSQITRTGIEVINDHPRWRPGAQTVVDQPPLSDQDYVLGDTYERPLDEMLMVFVPGGTFLMGSTPEQVESALSQCNQVEAPYCNPQFFSFESPQHEVTLDSFWIDQTEVTNAQFKRCVEDGLCEAPVACTWGAPDFNDETKLDNPVVCVDWEAAVNYCEWVGGRLPTEAEWEYAARGQNGSLYPWGDIFDSTLVNHCDSNCEEFWKNQDADDGYTFSSPVGTYPGGASWVGALDMSGNVFEWVMDWFGEYPGESQINPIGVESASFKVMRGGSYIYEQSRLRTPIRDNLPPTEKDSAVGFRCVVSR